MISSKVTFEDRVLSRGDALTTALPTPPFAMPETLPLQMVDEYVAPIAVREGRLRFRDFLSGATDGEYL